MRCPSTTKLPPPYSWTRLPTRNGAGVSSSAVPPADRRMSVERPSSVGRDSSQ